MEVLKLGKKAVELVWTSRALWLFGVFAGTGAGGAGGGGGGKHGPVTLGGHTLPGWIVPLLITGLLLAIAALVMHLVSEGALILGVRRRLDGERYGVRRGFTEGRRFMGRVLLIDLCAALAAAVVAAVAAAPGIALALHWLPVLPAVALLVPLVLLAVPVLLTVYMMRQWGLRAAVLADLPFGQAIAAARAELRGRLLDSLQLMLLEFAGQVGGGFAALALAIPGALVGVVVGLLAGLVPGLVAGVTIAAPFLFAAVGATNAFRSAIWTLGFLEGKDGGAAAA